MIPISVIITHGFIMNKKLLLKIFFMSFLLLCWIILSEMVCVAEVVKKNRNTANIDNKTISLYSGEIEYSEVDEFLRNLQKNSFRVESVVLRSLITPPGNNIEDTGIPYYMQCIYYGKYNIPLLKGGLIGDKTEVIMPPAGFNVQVGDSIIVNSANYTVIGKNAAADIFWVSKSDFHTNNNHVEIRVVLSDYLISAKECTAFSKIVRQSFNEVKFSIRPVTTFFIFTQEARYIFTIYLFFSAGVFFIFIYVSKLLLSKKSYLAIFFVLSATGIALALLWNIIILVLREEISHLLSVTFAANDFIVAFLLLSICILLTSMISIFASNKLSLAKQKNKRIAFAALRIISLTIIIFVSLLLTFYIIDLVKKSKKIELFRERLDAEGNSIYYVIDWADDFYNNINISEVTNKLNEMPGVKGILYSGVLKSSSGFITYASDYSFSLFRDGEYLPIFSKTTSNPFICDLMINNQDIITESNLEIKENDMIRQDLSFVVVFNFGETEIKSYLSQNGSVIGSHTVIERSFAILAESYSKKILICVLLLYFTSIFGLVAFGLKKECGF